MALTEETVEDKIEIAGDYKCIQIRTATVIKRDGVEISRSYHRHVVSPDISAENLANESSEVQALANLYFTPELKAAYATHMAAQGDA